MAVINIGPGVGLPTPQNQYPTLLNGAPIDTGNNWYTLPPGGYIVYDSGTFLTSVGTYSVLQWQDPYNNVWRTVDWTSARDQPFILNTAGYTFRVANMTGCPVGAVITNAGSSYVQGSTTLTPSTGNSVWAPVVGGSLSVSTVNVVGANYTLPPLVLIPGPPNPSSNPNGVGGIPATGYATISGGTVSGVTLTNVGAGYPAAPTVVLAPNPTDPNIATITNATVTMVLTNAGKLTGALLLNPGQPVAAASVNSVTLTVTGAGSSAAAQVLCLQTVASTSISAGGAGWGNTTNFAAITSAGGQYTTSTSAVGNPAIELTAFKPRPVNMVGTTNSGGTITTVTIIDGGLSVAAPTSVIIPGGTVPTTAATIAFTMGTAVDTVLIQPM